jgi:hypothetical protein
MVEESSLYNPGFLGNGGFLWWVGQIADDSYWRENIASGKIESKDKTPGWGYRYKVRIIGLHDQEEETIPSDQLPWAQVMYPTTAGGGQGKASATPSLRQGNFVFGFFLDGQDMQVPVIMGVLGNNAKTKLGTKIGTTKTNFSPTSVIAKGANPDRNLKIPDEGLSASKPAKGDTPTTENTDAFHLLSAADVKRNEIYQEKTIMLNPCDLVSSALKAISAVIERVTKAIDKYLNAALSYIDAVSSIIGQIQNIIANAACEIAKYMKIVFDKIFEYIMKVINKALAPTVNLIPPNQRGKYLKIKEIITQLLTCLFNQITKSLCGQIDAALNSLLNTESFPYNATPTSAPSVPICSVENLTGNIIFQNKTEINNGLNSILKTINEFLNDVLGTLGEVSGVIGGIQQVISGISSSITSALNFENLVLNFFGCELRPNCASSDYYTLQNGSGAGLQSQEPNKANVDAAAQKPTPAANTGDGIQVVNKAKEIAGTIPYASPTPKPP